MYPQPASRALQAGPGRDILPRIKPQPLRGHGPHTRPRPRPDSNVSFDRRNDEASPAGPGPARRPSRSRSKPGRRAAVRGAPLACSPPQSHHHARTPTFRRSRTEPALARIDCATSRADGHVSGAFSAAALAAALFVRRPPNSFGRALCELQRRSITRRLAGVRASPPGRQCRPEPGGISGSAPAVDTETPQEAP